eukprot:296966-Pyramimonas_sp.AAC.1
MNLIKPLQNGSQRLTAGRRTVAPAPSRPDGEGQGTAGSCDPVTPARENAAKARMGARGPHSRSTSCARSWHHRTRHQRT